MWYSMLYCDWSIQTMRAKDPTISDLYFVREWPFRNCSEMTSIVSLPACRDSPPSGPRVILPLYFLTSVKCAKNESLTTVVAGNCGCTLIANRMTSNHQGFTRAHFFLTMCTRNNPTRCTYNLTFATNWHSKGCVVSLSNILQPLICPKIVKKTCSWIICDVFDFVALF